MCFFRKAEILKRNLLLNRVWLNFTGRIKNFDFSSYHTTYKLSKILVSFNTRLQISENSNLQKKLYYMVISQTGIPSKSNYIKIELDISNL